MIKEKKAINVCDLVFFDGARCYDFIFFHHSRLNITDRLRVYTYDYAYGGNVRIWNSLDDEIYRGIIFSDPLKDEP